MTASDFLSDGSEEEPCNLILQSLDDGVYLIDAERRITYWNAGAERITGYLSQDVLGRRCGETLLAHCDSQGTSYCQTGCPLAGTMLDGHIRQAELFLRHRLGHRVPVFVRSAPVRDRSGKIVGAVEVFHVDTRRYGLMQKFAGLEQYGCLDAETGVSNRAMAAIRTRHRLEDLKVFGIPVGYALLEVAGKKAVVGKGGREAWNSLLRAAAQTIAETVPPSGFVGRMSENRFLVILGNCDPISLDEVTQRAAALVRATEVTWWGEPLRPDIRMCTTMGEPDDSPDKVITRLNDELGPSKE